MQNLHKQVRDVTGPILSRWEFRRFSRPPRAFGGLGDQTADTSDYCKLKECCCKLNHRKYARALEEGGLGIGIFIFLSGKLLYFFLGLCVTIRKNFLKFLTVRAVANTLQPQISVTNVVSNLIC